MGCPWCGERIHVLIDPSVGDQDYVEDCSVCCQPIMLQVRDADQDTMAVTARAENR